nr:MAG TPA: hypothetical protein [Caudoviricetes sp.]
MPYDLRFGGEGNEHGTDGVSGTCVLKGADAVSCTRKEGHLSRTQP